MGAQQSTTPIGELYAGDGQAQLVQPVGAGMSVVSGSELSAGIAAARLKLSRGGQLRLCPRSSLTVNSGKFGLTFAMNTGALEFDYTLFQRGSDYLITPDFSIRLQGPGKYHFAVGANQNGDTCVKSLSGNAAPIELSELMSSASYRVRPQDSMLFHQGKLNGNTVLAPAESCGCPETAPVMEAAAPPAPQPTTQPPPANAASVPVQPAAEIPPDRPGQVHVEVDTPFVFSGKNAQGIEPYSAAKISLSTLPNLFFVQETVDPVVLPEKPAQVSVREEAPAKAATRPQPAREKKEKKGFFGRLKGMFTGIFHH
ncbi:MAG TPA: hypothetical protein VJV96_11950 [Candidatus Angelobacter sp.]|nr:hypothetical protein [Candidatus Angelobacter sp.]